MALREAITNVVRHSGGARCRVSLRPQGDQAVLPVREEPARRKSCARHASRGCFTEDPGAGASGGGCTATAMPAFTGSLSGGRITAQRTEAYDCRAADGNEYRLTVRLVASR